jgi:hypothetical protein
MLLSLFIFTVRGDRSLIIGGDRCSDSVILNAHVFE